MLALLRKQTNGAVTGSMEERGVFWPLNYGVSVPAIREVAAGYAPDHSLGRLLYQQQVRELRLAGIMVADPAAVSADELPFWERGVINTEVAEHLSFLLSATDVLPDAIGRWLLSDNEWLRYALLLSVTRRIASMRSAAGLDVEMILGSFRSVLSADCRPLWRSFAAFVNALYRVSSDHRLPLERLAAELLGTTGPAADYISGELYLEL